MSLWRFLPAQFKPRLEEDEEMPARIYVNIPAETETPSIFLYHEGNQLGPFTSNQVAQMIALGSIDTNASYWREGMAEWRNVSEFSRTS